MVVKFVVVELKECNDDYCLVKLVILCNQWVVYEVYLKGLMQLYLEILEVDCGKFNGVVYEVVIEYLIGLGVIIVQFMLLVVFMLELYIIEKGLMNYWGYNLVNYFVFELCYSQKYVIKECMNMVDVYYEVGMEVVVDVVFNYIVEGGKDGLVLLF